VIVAIVPAAGESRRMGRPKLLLRLGERSVIARVVTALRKGGVHRVIVVTPPLDAPGGEDVGREAAGAGAELVVPDIQPPDMRTSFELALTILEADGDEPEMVLLTPADCPALTPTTVAVVIQRARAHPDGIVVPTVDGRRGHPVALPWECAREVRGLPRGVGVNALVTTLAHTIIEVAVDDPGAVADLDSPDDYRRWAEVHPPTD
jgi:molybdenum cofactor cytidylyltransferase